jgi:ferrochelatase
MSARDEKIAVILMNLGGPDRREAIKPFLYNFFMDKNIIPLPVILRRFVAWRISKTRGDGEALVNYNAMGGASPILKNTQEQVAALEKKLAERYSQARVFVSMRYWHPRAQEVVSKVRDFNPEKIVLLPLYPQFSTTTTFSSFEEWMAEAASQGLDAPTRKICCYPEDDGFIAASAQLLRAELEKAPRPVRVLFSAHGLPEKVIRGGDPYQYQCEKTAERIVRALDMQGLDWQVCYQSRVGRLKWIGPSTEEALQKAAQDKIGVVVYPHAFVSEHVETIVEIGEEYRQLAEKLGIPYFARVPTVSVHDAFIGGLAKMVFGAVAGETRPRFCPQEFSRCGCML